MSLTGRAWLWCACLEAPLLAALIAGLNSGSARISVVLALLVLLHLVPLGALYLLWLWCFGHGSPPGGAPHVSVVAYWALAFLIQTAVMLPVAVALLRRRAPGGAA